MSWNYVCDKSGSLEIIVSRWYNHEGDKRECFVAVGFEPYEPVEVDILTEDRDLAIKPFQGGVE